MGFTKKTWKNRIAEYINRRLITMEDGSTSLVTVARDEVLDVLEAKEKVKRVIR